MKITKDNVYTDKHGRFRKVIAFYFGRHGEPRIQYEQGAFLKGEWYKFGGDSIRNCLCISFLRWAKGEVKEREGTE